MSFRVRVVYRAQPVPPRRLVGASRFLPGQVRDPVVVVSVSAPARATFTHGRAYVLWGAANLTAPAATLSAGGGSAAGANSFAYTLTAPTLSAFGGASAALTAPTPTLTITGTVTNFGTAALTAPSATLAAAATGTALASAALTFGNGTSTYRIVGYTGAVASVTIDGFTVTASGTSGGVARAALTLPLFELVATGTVRGVSGAALVMPAARLGGVGVAWLMSPSATLVAIGSAIVTATYEAYAVNLNHKPRPNVEPIDETTRYTNFPFDRIVRYQNSYFGVAADGLYLLEGTTDYAATPTQIPWAFKTAMTDFRSQQKKSIESVYFGGRLGATTVTVYVGEDSAPSYPYPVPTTSTVANYRQVVGRGIKARYFAFGAAGTGVMELDDMDFSTSVLARRI